MDMNETNTARADLHVHSTASEESKLGVQRSLGLPECATPPEEVYELAKRRGMDFVTITDHDTIDGALELADRPDCFVSEELTAWFRGEPQAVHVLCFAITSDDHEWLQLNANDVELCAEYLHANEIACALAHPFYSVEAPLTPRHRRALADLFPVWEVRNGSRSRELNMPAFVYIETHGGTGVAGSDDHAGVDVGRTFTETPPAATPAEFLAHIRAGHAVDRGDQGSAAKWAHAAMALAIRTLGPGGGGGPADPAAVMDIVERVVREGSVRRGAKAAGLEPRHARDLLRAWLDAIGLEGDEGELLAMLQADDFSHAGLFRRARSVHEAKLVRAVEEIGRIAVEGRDYARAGQCLFDACMAAIPYAPAAAFLGKEKAKLSVREGEPRRVALVADAVGGMHGVTRTLEELRIRGVPGFEVEVIGTDRNVDRRLPAVAELDIPYYAGLEIGVPTMPAIVETLAEGRYDVVHLCSPGPAGVAALLVARMMELPTLGSYHTELGAYATLRSGDPGLRALADHALGAFYGACDAVLSPSAAADASLHALGVLPERVGRWERGVDLERFDPARRDAGLLPGDVNVLYVGRQTKEKGVDLLADAFLEARGLDPRLHLVLAGGGPEEPVLRERLGEYATFLGWLRGEELARVYASADVFLFASRTDTFGQVILEAQASGLPVVAVAEGGPTELIRDGETGLLRAPEAAAMAPALAELAADRDLRAGLAARGLEAVAGRTWAAASAQLASGYERALGRRTAQRLRPAA
jgi:glycosyltransferase involved in cell wall biosynthesis/predicted metal-dependent phosphoesterase TrpH